MCVCVCDWLILLRIMSSNFIHTILSVRIPFLSKVECYSIVCANHILLIYSFINGFLGYFHVLTFENNAASNLSIQISLLRPYFQFFGTYAKLLDHMVILFLIFWGAILLLSTVAMPSYIPTNSTQVFQLPHILTNVCCCQSFKLEHLTC